MMAIAFLFAPTVPSEPRPQNTAWVTSSELMSRSSSHGSELWLTSSWMPIVTWLRGRSAVISSNRPSSIAGVSSLLERP